MLIFLVVTDTHMNDDDDKRPPEHRNINPELLWVPADAQPDDVGWNAPAPTIFIFFLDQM